MKKVYAGFVTAGVILLCLGFGVVRDATDLKKWNSNALAQVEDYRLYLPLVSVPPVPVNIFGVELYTNTANNGFEKMADAGMSWMRLSLTGVLWSEVESYEGERNWSKLSNVEEQILEARNNGVEVILVVRSTPNWAQQVAGSSCGPIREDKWASFGNFMADLVTRYSQPPYNVKYWEIWNEPDVDYRLVPGNSPFGCWGDWGDKLYYGGEKYGKVLKAITPRIKGADPQAKVIVGGLLLDCDPRYQSSKDCTSSRYFEGILKETRGEYFDGVGIHAYDYYLGQLGRYSNLNWMSQWDVNGPSSLQKAAFIKEKMQEYRVAGKNLYLTENALLCDLCTDNPDFEKTKAYYIVHSYTGAMAVGIYANIWYDVFGWRNSGLLNGDLSSKEAYVVYQNLSYGLKDRVFSRTITEFAGVWGYEFRKGNQRLWVLWSRDGLQHAVNLHESPTHIETVFGVSLENSTSILVSIEPVMIYFE